MTASDVAPINELVARLRNDSGLSVPYVGSFSRGVHAPILSVLRDPGRATERTGKLDISNPDPTSRVQRGLIQEVGLAPSDLCPWNAYPWPHDGQITETHMARGARVLIEVIGLMRDLRAILLQGKEAANVWALARSIEPALKHPTFAAIETCHPLGTRRRTPADTSAARAEQRAKWQHAANVAHRRDGR